MPARKSGSNLRLSSVIGYAEIAEKMGVSPSSVIAYRSRDETFPAPVTPASFRSPGFDEAEIDRWLVLRETSQRGRPGRPSRMLTDERISLSSEAMEALRARVKTAELSNVAVCKAAGISDTALWFRYQGKSRWRLSELEAIAKLLGTSVDALRAAESDSGRPKRAPAKSRPAKKK